MSTEKVALTAKIYGQRGIIVGISDDGRPIVRYVLDGIEYKIVQNFSDLL